MIKLSKKEFNKIFEVKSKNITLSPEFRELIEILIHKTNLDFFEILDLIINW